MKTKDKRLDKYKTFFNKGKEAERKRILKIIINEDRLGVLARQILIERLEEKQQ